MLTEDEEDREDDESADKGAKACSCVVEVCPWGEKPEAANG